MSSPPPATHVAFLRGINVGSAHRLPMARLVKLFEAAGARDVRTYVRSGNVVFAASNGRVRAIPKLVGDAIEAEFGFRAPLVTRSSKQLAAALADDPFAHEELDDTQVHLGFLPTKPAAATVRELDPERSPGDRFAVHGREVYLACPNGLARTRLTNQWFDARLGTVCTFRNRRTVRRLLEMAGIESGEHR